jgi:hypothetical protein
MTVSGGERTVGAISYKLVYSEVMYFLLNQGNAKNLPLKSYILSSASRLDQFVLVYVVVPLSAFVLVFFQLKLYTPSPRPPYPTLFPPRYPLKHFSSME